MTDKVNINKECCCVRKQCVRHGNCKECIEYHSTSKRYPGPYCEKKLKKGKNS